MSAQVSIDPGRCVGSGDCALTAPEAFEVVEEVAQARVLPGAGGTDPSVLQRAAYACPTGAISLTTEG